MANGTPTQKLPGADEAQQKRIVTNHARAMDLLDGLDIPRMVGQLGEPLHELTIVERLEWLWSRDLLSDPTPSSERCGRPTIWGRCILPADHDGPHRGDPDRMPPSSEARCTSGPEVPPMATWTCIDPHCPVHGEARDSGEGEAG